MSEDTKMIVSEGASEDRNSLAMFRKIAGLGGTSVSASNFTGDNNRLLALTAVAIGGDAKPGGEMVGKRFTFTHWYVHPVEILNQKTYEVSTEPRTVLIDKDGKAISFVSRGVFGSLDVILKFMGTGDLGDGVTVEIRSKRSRSVGNVLLLHPIVGE